MANEMIYRNNFFIYGEVGERLNGIRESEIYQQSAREIRNFIITELGNLKFAKKYIKKNIPVGDIIEVLDTRYNFFIVVTSTHVYTLNKEDYTVLYSLQHNLNKAIAKNTNVKMFDDSLIICSSSPQVFEFNAETGNIGKSNFLSLLEYPVVEKEDVKMDVYKVYKVGSELRVAMLSTYTNPKLESKEDGIYLYETGLKLARVYKQYKSSIDKDDIKDPAEGLMFGILYRFNKNEDNKSYILGNTNVSFSDEVNDTVYGSGYFTNMNIKNINGDLVYGKLQELKNNFTDVGVLSDRLYIIKDNTFYFSRKDNFFDFRNGINSDDPFYFKPTPINNQKPNILRSKVGNALYVATDKGVYVISYSKVLTNSNYSVFIAGEVPCSYECELVGDNFFYLTVENKLKCVQAVPNSFGYESYSTYDAEKYDITRKMGALTKITIEGRTVLIATNLNKKEIYLYESLDYNQFRRTSLDIDASNELFGYRENFICNNAILEKSELNYSEAVLKLNPPHMQTSKGGSYSNDYASTIQRVFMKLLNEDREAVKGVYIFNTPLQNKTYDDLFSTYKCEQSERVNNGYTIRILSNENNKVLEILGIDTKVKIASD